MGHLTEGNDELLKRVRRIAGQVTAIEKRWLQGSTARRRCTWSQRHAVRSTASWMRLSKSMSALMWHIPIFRPRSAPQGRKN